MHPGNLRWRERRSRFRRPDEQIRRYQYDVGPIQGDRVVKAFVERHHYSGTYPAARMRFGLFRAGQLVGVAVFSHPTNEKTLTNVFGGDAKDSLELGRFVLLDDVPGNGETFFLGQCLRTLRNEGYRGVVSFSDPVPRYRSNGEAVFPGHVGTIYQAGNAVFLGRGSPGRLYLLPDGRSLSRRAISKIRNNEQGRSYAAQQLVAVGADDPDRVVGLFYESWEEWLAFWLARLTRNVYHPGNFRYGWSLNGPELRPRGRYPKRAA